MTLPADIVPGQLWTFVHADGKRVQYRIETAEKDPGAQAIAKIVNVETGGIGWVTKWWLRRAPDGSRRGHFIYDGAGEAAQAA